MLDDEKNSSLFFLDVHLDVNISKLLQLCKKKSFHHPSTPKKTRNDKVVMKLTIDSSGWWMNVYLTNDYSKYFTFIDRCICLSRCFFFEYKANCLHKSELIARYSKIRQETVMLQKNDGDVGMGIYFLKMFLRSGCDWCWSLR